MFPFFSPRTAVTHFVLYATFAYTFLTPHFPVINAALWFMGIAWWFSLSLPILDRIIRRIGPGMSVVIFLSIAFLQRSISLFLEGNTNFYITNSFLGRIDDFVLGMCLAIAYAKGMRLRSWAHIVPIVGLAVLWIYTVKSHSRILPLQAHAFQFTLASIVVALSVFALLSLRVHISSLWTWPMQMIGRMSFSIYIWHGPLQEIHPEMNLYRLAWYWIVLLLVSALSYRFIEFGHIKDIRTLLPRNNRPTEAL
jgi:peptidoglycan/LPS O-acetylase OafA/YrhL